MTYNKHHHSSSNIILLYKTSSSTSEAPCLVKEIASWILPKIHLTCTQLFSFIAVIDAMSILRRLTSTSFVEWISSITLYLSDSLHICLLLHPRTPVSSPSWRFGASAATVDLTTLLILLACQLIWQYFPILYFIYTMRAPVFPIPSFMLPKAASQNTTIFLSLLLLELF